VRTKVISLEKRKKKAKSGRGVEPPGNDVTRGKNHHERNDVEQTKGGGQVKPARSTKRRKGPVRPHAGKGTQKFKETGRSSEKPKEDKHHPPESRGGNALLGRAGRKVIIGFHDLRGGGFR